MRQRQIRFRKISNKRIEREISGNRIGGFNSRSGADGLLWLARSFGCFIWNSKKYMSEVAMRWFMRWSIGSTSRFLGGLVGWDKLHDSFQKLGLLWLLISIHISTWHPDISGQSFNNLMKKTARNLLHSASIGGSRHMNCFFKYTYQVGTTGLSNSTQH